MEDLIMKKLIMFVMVLMLCMGTAAKADPIASYSFEGSLADSSGNGNDGTMNSGTEAYSSDVPSAGGSGGKSLYLDGDSSVITPINTCMFDGGNFTITFWFKTTTIRGIAIGIGSSGNNDAEHHVTIFEGPEGNVINDVWYTGNAATDTGGMANDTWHHYALVHENPDTQTLYIDGDPDGTGDIGYEYDCSFGGSLLIGDLLNEAVKTDVGADYEGPLVAWNGLIKDVGIYDVALDEAGVEEAMNDGFPLYGPKNPLVVDPNVMLVYETGETVGDFDVSLRFPPVGQGPGNQGNPYTITVTIDPNGGNGGWGASAAGEKDIQLLAGQGADNQVTLTFNTTNWNVPQTVFFKALEDTVPEPPEFIEINSIGVTITSTVAEPNLNGDLGGNPWTKNQVAQVWDNDQANILFSVSPFQRNNPKTPVTGPVQLWEEPGAVNWWDPPLDKWVKIWVTLQVKPLIDGDPCQPTSVKLQAVIEGEVAGDNFPLTDPCLPYEEIDDPNGLIFTAGNYDTPQPIKVWGVDDSLLQAGGASADGDENYNVGLIVTVIDDGGDSRFTGLERIVDLDIEDNECGAYGMLPMDVSNPYYVTDPNWTEDDPDCYVNIYDIIRMAKEWLDCTDPQTAGCVNLYE
jgi:hypothetical protein